MREIIQIGVGQCGCNIAYEFWKQISNEHIISPDGIRGIDDQTKLEIYFNETSTNRYVPRAILIDLDPEGIDRLMGREYSSLFSPDSLISDKHGSGNNWAVGNYLEGATLSDKLMDLCRSQIEKCDSFQGVQMTHALSGGTGSGLGAKIHQHFREEYPQIIFQTLPILPSFKDPENVVSPYNLVLSIHQIIEIVDCALIFDNTGLYRQVERNLILEKPNYIHLNQIIARVMSNLTSTMRFKGGNLNTSMRKLCMNLTCFPRMHFYMNSLRSNDEKSVDSIRQLHQIENQNCNATIPHIIIASYIQGRSENLSMSELEEGVQQVRRENPEGYLKWIESNYEICSSQYVGRKDETEYTGIFNTLSIGRYFEIFDQQFTSLFRRKAFVHWYTGVGMDEMEFTEAESNFNDLIYEYNQYFSQYDPMEQEQDSEDQ